ncbi:MAG: DNA replication/repair protein RecF [Cyclobacteriaceae bacterium]
MYLSRINLSNFKNYEAYEEEFSDSINCIVGANGTGKTNLLDAIFYLSMSKSAFNNIENQNIRHDEAFFFIKGDFLLNQKKYKLLASLQKGQKKTLKVNNKAYEKISEHIGRFPLVMIAPDDQDLVKEGSETRRKFIDGLLAQIDREYLQNLIVYYKILKNRNLLLKQFAEKEFFDKDLLEPYNRGILQYGQLIYERRTAFCNEYLPLFLRHYQNLTLGKENVDLKYVSELDTTDFELEFRGNLSRDRMLQRTSMGIHRDDFLFEIAGYPLKKFGSQGQQKSYIVALKLAMFEIIQQQKEFKPLLLLDDIFDKLDEQRIKRLMEMVASHTFGQIFITDAREERTLKILEQNQLQAKIINVQKRLKNI